MKMKSDEDSRVKQGGCSSYLHILRGEAARLTKANNQVGSQSATAQTSLLATTGDDGFQTDTRATADVASSDTLGAVDLVAGDGHEINV